MSFSWKDRRATLNSLHENRPELLIIGGGVVGCSIAYHAAALGLNCVLMEKNDIASGASGNSTGLAHAGLRYLAQGRVGYVFREGHERARLQEMAPHWVRPFNFIFPVYKKDPVSFATVRLGTWIYDVLGWLDALWTRGRLVRRHRVIKAPELLSRVPGVRSEGLHGATEYFVDAQIQDTRFTLGLAQEAARRGARILTYTEVLGFSPQETIQKVSYRDRITDESYDISQPLVINATGAWIDEVRQSGGWRQPRLRLSKGIHLVVDHLAEVPLIFSTQTKGQVFFVLPFGREASIIGTTDTAVDGSPDEAAPDGRDVFELIRRLFHFFPYLRQGSHLMEAIELYKQVHVRDVYWGIRPLLRQSGSTVSASREHAVIKESPSFWSIPGVKLTAGRAVGEEVAREAWNILRKSAAPEIAFRPLPGGEFKDYDFFVQEAQKRFRLGENSDDIIAYLVSTYGTRYVEVLRWADHEPHYRERVLADEPWIHAQAAHAVEEEMVLTLNDFLWRRTKWSHLRDIPDTSLHRIVNVLAERLDWAPDDVEHQLAEYRTEWQRHRLHE